MRGLLAGMIALACAGAAFAQEQGVEAGLGPFQFGMSMEAARAVAPNSAWRLVPGEGGLQSLSGGPRIEVAGAPFSAILAFGEDRLKQIVLLAQSSTSCAETVPAFVGQLEAAFGSFGAAPVTVEQGRVVEVIRTEGGSELRVREAGTPPVRQIHSSRRDGISIQVLGEPGEGGSACRLTLLFDSTTVTIGPNSELTLEELDAAPTWLNEDWEARPMADDFEQHYPPGALARGVSGAAILDCVINDQRKLRCLVRAEEPGGEHFDTAALRISRAFVARQEPNAESVIGKRVRITIRFTVF